MRLCSRESRRSADQELELAREKELEEIVNRYEKANKRFKVADREVTRMLAENDDLIEVAQQFMQRRTGRAGEAPASTDPATTMDSNNQIEDAATNATQDSDSHIKTEL